MNTRIVRDAIKKEELRTLAEAIFGDMVKGVVDLERGIIGVGGEMHADIEQVLLDDGSERQHLWGFNWYPEQPSEHQIEYDSMINIRPSVGNLSRTVEDETIRARMRQIIIRLVKE